MQLVSNESRENKPNEDTFRFRQRILELRRDCVSFPQIGEILGTECGRPAFSQGYIYKCYKKALKAIIAEDVAEVRKMELARLDELQQEILNVLRTPHYLVNQGRVVQDFLLDENGRQILDEEGQPIPIRLQDDSVKLQAVNAALKLMERRAKLLGLDAPTKVAATDPSGNKEASLVQFYLPENGRDVVDVEPEKG